MPTPQRTAIKNALLAKIAAVTFPSTINGLTTWGTAPTRRLKMFNDIDPSIQPAAFLVQHREGYDTSKMGTPARRWLELGIWCFAPSGGDSVIGDDYLDSMMEGIEDIFEASIDDRMRNEMTLGGLCFYCRIDRPNMIRDPGDIDGQALLVVPVRIMLP